MRHVPNIKVEEFRVTSGAQASQPSDGNNGAFLVMRPRRPRLRCIVSDGAGWDHVSVSIDVVPSRCPTWEEMCHVKELFFRDDEVVVQYHPARADYVNQHEFVLHLWRFQEQAFPKPASIMVGVVPREPGLTPGANALVVTFTAAEMEMLAKAANKCATTPSALLQALCSRMLGVSLALRDSPEALTDEQTRTDFLAEHRRLLLQQLADIQG